MAYYIGGYHKLTSGMPGAGGSRSRSRKRKASGKKKRRGGGKRKLKFGSPAWRAKYLGHGKRRRRARA